jgi:hypothetical protein
MPVWYARRMSEPWNLTEAQRQQFREAHAEWKRTRPPSKPWRVRLTGGACQDYRSQSAAYDAINTAVRHSGPGRFTVEHFERGAWRLYERIEPQEG